MVADDTDRNEGNKAPRSGKGRNGETAKRGKGEPEKGGTGEREKGGKGERGKGRNGEGRVLSGEGLRLADSPVPRFLLQWLPGSPVLTLSAES
jgi:hypothetical protein